MLALTLPVHVAFRLANDVGVLIALFRSSIPRPPIPLFMLHCAPHDALRKTRGRVDRYSFLVRLFSSSTSDRFIPAHWLPAFLRGTRRNPPLYLLTANIQSPEVARQKSMARRLAASLRNRLRS